MNDTRPVTRPVKAPPKPVLRDNNHGWRAGILRLEGLLHWRALIASADYFTPARLSIVADRVLEELHARWPQAVWFWRSGPHAPPQGGRKGR